MALFKDWKIYQYNLFYFNFLNTQVETTKYKTKYPYVNYYDHMFTA